MGQVKYYLWQLFHNTVVHGLLLGPLGFMPRWLQHLHDWSARKAWPDELPVPEEWDNIEEKRNEMPL